MTFLFLYILIISCIFFIIAFFIKKYSKTAAYILTFLPLILIGFISYNLYERENRIPQSSCNNRLIGKYYFDTFYSKYNANNFQYFTDLELYVKDDNTFYFTKGNPYIKGLKGYWQHFDGYEDDCETQISFDNDNFKTIETINNQLVFEGSSLYQNQSGFKIVFTKTN